MYKKLHLAIAQVEAAAADPESNTRKALSLIKKAAEKDANMICFPELFYSSYDVDKIKLARCAISREHEFFKIMQTTAKKYSINILMSYPEKNDESDKPYISYAFIDSDGNFAGNHRKSYLWLDENEKAKQSEPIYDVIKTPFGNIGTLICYEIEFPEPARILTLKGAEIIISTMAFDTIPNLHKYISAIGILNQVYAVGVNGYKSSDPKRGGSCVADQRGNIVYQLDPGKEQLGFFDIDLGKENRRNEAPHKDDLITDTLNQLSEIGKWNY